MPQIEERVAALEARMDATAELRVMIDGMRSGMDRGFAEVRQDMKGQAAELRDEMKTQLTVLRDDMNLRLAERQEDTGVRFAAFNDQVNARFAELRGDLTDRWSHTNTLLVRMLDRQDRHFTWLIGVQLSTMLIIVGALLTAWLRQAP